MFYDRHFMLKKSIFFKFNRNVKHVFNNVSKMDFVKQKLRKKVTLIVQECVVKIATCNQISILTSIQNTYLLQLYL
jgi:hypothetical protein